jgi:hypothetical protein
MTNFNKRYGRRFAKIHDAFYKRTFKGRPKSNQGKRILKALEEYKGTKLSMDKLADIASKKLAELGEMIEPSSIRKHYYKELGAIKKHTK